MYEHNQVNPTPHEGGISSRGGDSKKRVEQGCVQTDNSTKNTFHSDALLKLDSWIKHHCKAKGLEWGCCFGY